MRDNNENMIELIGVEEDNNSYSSLIRHTIAGEKFNLRFGITLTDYIFLKKILQFRPFENTGVTPYRYFFALSYRRDISNEELGFINMRVEQLDKHKQYEFQISRKYIANILWFDTLKNKQEVEGLIENEKPSCRTVVCYLRKE